MIYKDKKIISKQREILILSYFYFSIQFYFFYTEDNIFGFT